MCGVKAATPPGSRCAAGGALLLSVSHQSLPLLSVQGWKAKRNKTRWGYPCSIRETGSDSKQGGRNTSKSWKHKSLCSKCLSVSSVVRARRLLKAPTPLPICNQNVNLKKVPGDTYSWETARSCGVYRGTWKPRIPTPETSCHPFCFPEPPVSGSSDLLYFLLLLSVFVFHLSLLADYYGNDRGRVSAGAAWSMHRWVCRITSGMSWRVTRVFVSWQFGSKFIVIS